MELLKYREKKQQQKKHIEYDTYMRQNVSFAHESSWMCFFEKRKNSFSLCFSLRIMSAESRDIKKAYAVNPLVAVWI